MQVSVIILNYNTFELTCKCIQSVLDQTKDLVYEIILVDNASVECDASLFQVKFPDIKLVQSQINLGFAGGNNLGLKSALGDVILLLNSDTELKNNAIKLCYDYLISHKKVGAVTTKLLYPDGRIQSNCQRFPNVFYNFLELLRFQKFFKQAGGRLQQGPFFDYSEIVETDWTWGAFFMFPKAVMQSLPEGKLYEKFFMYGEDLKWCWDIRKAGYKVVYVPDGKVIHHLGGSSGPKFHEMDKNRNIFLKEHYSPLKIWWISLSEKLLRS